MPEAVEEEKRRKSLRQRFSQQKRRDRYWFEFAYLLNTELARCPLHAFLTPPPDLRRTWRPCCLADVLLITIWEQAAANDTVLRSCPTCGGLFGVSRTDAKKVYCSFRCKNLEGVREHRRGASQPQGHR